MRVTTNSIILNAIAIIRDIIEFSKKISAIINANIGKVDIIMLLRIDLGILNHISFFLIEINLFTINN
jgi:hypothetical protein